MEQSPNAQQNNKNEFMDKPVQELKDLRNDLMTKIAGIEDKMETLKKENPADFVEFKKLNGQKTAFENILKDILAALNKENDNVEVAEQLEREARMFG